MTKAVGSEGGPRRTERHGSDEFCKIVTTAACMADYPKHIAPTSPQKTGLGSMR